MLYSRFPVLKYALSSTLLFTGTAWGAVFNVTNNNDSGAGSLRQAISDLNAAPSGADTILFSAALANNTINLASNLPPINIQNTNAVIFDAATNAPGLKIDGNNNQIFFVNTGIVRLDGNGGGANALTLTTGRATGAQGGTVTGSTTGGGGGGGGGAAGGGAIFIGKGANVIISNVTLENNQAIGGTGGAGGFTGTSPNGGSGGAGAFGGGAGGASTFAGGGGGGGGFPGGGLGGTGSAPPTNGGNAATIGNALIGGGGGGGGCDFSNPTGLGGIGAPGGNNGGDGGIETGSPPAGAGQGLGGGGGEATSFGAPGGAGGPDGGGGGGGGVNANANNGGAGGFGAGGGGGGAVGGGVGGAGGLGGGGGGGGFGNPIGTGGVSPFAGGTGGHAGAGGAGGGGGGAGLGGAVFIHKDGQLEILNNFALTGNAAVGGTGGVAGGTGATPGSTGLGLGNDFFMATDGGTNIIGIVFQQTNNLTLTNPIITDQGSYSAGIDLAGPATVTLTGNNTVRVVGVSGTGTLALGPGATLPTSAILVMDAAPTGTFDITDCGHDVTFATIIGTQAGKVIQLGGHNLVVATPANLVSPFTPPYIYAGRIQSSVVGSGTVKVTGNNMWTLSGTANTHFGTIIDGNAILAIAGDGSLGTAGYPVTWTGFGINTPTLQLNGNVIASRPLNFNSPLAVINLRNRDFTLTNVGSSSGVGLLDIQGTTGTFFLQGPFNHLGGTIISGGTLAIQGAGSIQGDVEVDGGTFDISAATPQSIANLLGFSPAGQLNLGTNKLTINPTADHSFAGVINGAAASEFILNTPHTLTLTGASTTVGTVEIAQGTIVVAPGAVVPAHFIVDAPGTLRGTGTVGRVTNSGIVQPGMSIGTLNIVGDYVESGTLQVEVNDTGASSSINVGGNLTINPGTTLKLLPEPGNYDQQEIFTVATFAGVRTGTYTNVITNLPNRFTVQELYNPNNIQVLFGKIPFDIIVPGEPAAKCIETIPQDDGSDGQFIINALEAISDDLNALQKAFHQMLPSQFGALALAQQNNDILVRSALTQRFGFRRWFEPKEEHPPIKTGTVWFEPAAKYAKQRPQQQNKGYHQSTAGGILGTDYRVCSTLYLGGALGFTYTNLHWLKTSAKALINSYYGAFYGTWYNKRAYLDGSFVGSYNHYHAERRIRFADVRRTAHNGHGGYQLAGSLGTGVYFYPGKAQIEPYARADYIFTHQRAQREHGAQSLDLNIRPHNSRYVRTDLGAKFFRFYEGEKAKFIPYFKISWVWEKQLDRADFRSSFTQSSCSFVTHGLHPVRNLVAPGVGLTVLSQGEKFSFSVHDDAEISRKFWENRAYMNFSYRY